MALIKYGLSNELNREDITHTNQIDASVRQVLNIPANAVLVVRGVENYEGALSADDVVSFQPKANSKAA